MPSSEWKVGLAMVDSPDNRKSQTSAQLVIAQLAGRKQRLAWTASTTIRPSADLLRTARKTAERSNGIPSVFTSY